MCRPRDEPKAVDDVVKAGYARYAKRRHALTGDSYSAIDEECAVALGKTARTLQRWRKEGRGSRPSPEEVKAIRQVWLGKSR